MTIQTLKIVLNSELNFSSSKHVELQVKIKKRRDQCIGTTCLLRTLRHRHK